VIGHRDTDELVRAALALVPEQGRAVLGIAGVPGSGKTTLAEAVVTGVAHECGDGFVAHVPMDGFHLADVQLERLGLLDRKGAPETFDAAGYAALLQRLHSEAQRPVYAPGFERTLEQPVAASVVVPAGARLVVTEGNYLLLDRPEWRRARQALDAVWWVEVDDTTRRERLVARHVRFGKPPEAAAAWVAAVDEGNSELIRRQGDPPDRVVVETPGGWGFGPAA
jgi:pantothenate kinase